MKPLITWLTIGACLLLFGCSEEQKTQTKTRQLTSSPQITYCNEVNILYNESFIFSPDEDLQLFQAKVNGYLTDRQMNRFRLDGQTLMKAIGHVSEAGGYSRRKTKLLAEALKQTEWKEL